MVDVNKGIVANPKTGRLNRTEQKSAVKNQTETRKPNMFG